MKDVLADLTLRLQASTAEFNQKLTEAGKTVNKFGTKTKKDLKDAQQRANESFGKLKEGFSTMTQGLTAQLDEVTGGFSSLLAGATSSMQGVLGLSKGMNVLKVAMASTGIGLIVVALGSLIAYLTQTQEGMDMVNEVLEPLKAGFGALLGVLQNVGKFIFDNFIPVFASLGDLMLGVSAIMTGDVSGGIARLKAGMDGLGKAFGDAKKLAVDSAKHMKDSLAVGSQIAALEKSIALAEIERAESRDKLKRQLKEYNDVAEDTAKTEQERIEAAKASVAITKQIEALDKKVINMQLKKLKLQQSLNDTSDADKLEYAQKEAELERQIAESLEMHTTQRNKLNILLTAQGKKQAEINALLKEEAEHNASMNARIGSIEVDGKGLQMDPVEMQIDVKPVDPSKLTEVQERILESFRATQERMREVASEVSGMIQGALTSAISGFAEAFGQALAGDLSGIKGFFNNLLMMVLDFGKQFGQLLISIGLAKVALDKIGISGIGAVIAGTALVALTSVAKSLLSKGPDMPKFANGGIAPGGMALVGERGPELVNLSQGSRVNSYDQTKRLLAGAGGQNIHVHITGKVSGQDILLAVEETQRRNGINF